MKFGIILQIVGAAFLALMLVAMFKATLARRDQPWWKWLFPIGFLLDVAGIVVVASLGRYRAGFVAGTTLVVAGVVAMVVGWRLSEAAKQRA